ncbi:zinc-binding metallopeptidase family protein [Pararhizobium gei]|uniref:zinc-binding metallopeptidase family protein n=1 Tax=Pararhizobium gei TaxID=1395951 RepID=UPI0023DAD323|nr:putative zinc-binding peptidase [Rhizobium gei]
MRLFACANCGNPIHFDNRSCINCGSRLGFLPEDVMLYALVPANDGNWQVFNGHGGAVRFCANEAADICNWLLPVQDHNIYCAACRHNRIVPVTDNAEGLARWQKIGQAQRHLFYSLLRWNLPHPGRDVDPNGGLVFDYLADEVDANGNVIPAMTGHEDGLISLRAAEANDATRESVRVSMGEPYRTLLGHFRHEIGHFYFEQLVRDDQTLWEARSLFGDEREDYAEALKRNYEQGPPADWQTRFISTYASCHPAEDFAECWAHFFHIVDTLETARAFGLSTDPRRHGDMATEIAFDPYRAPDAQGLVDAWVPLSVALNSLQRSMGQPDSYPFILSPPVVEKLNFINRLIRRAGEGYAR